MGIKPRTSGSAASSSNHYITEAVFRSETRLENDGFTIFDDFLLFFIISISVGL
jgi:hypothetical protein